MNEMDALACPSMLTFMQIRFLIAEVGAVGLAAFVVWFLLHYIWHPYLDGVAQGWGVLWLFRNL